MTFERQMGFWLSALFVLVLSLWLLQEILLPFIAGFVLAYFLDPVADALERLGLSRLVATLVILLAAVAGIVIVILVVAPVLGEQALLLAQDLPELIKKLVTRLEEITPQRLKDLLAKNGSTGGGSMGDIAGQATGFVATLLKSLLSGGMALVNILSLVVVTPIVAFYLLLDWDHIVAKIDSWLPRDHADEIRDIARDINTAMAGFIRGQGTVCLLLGVFYALGLSLLGLKFGLAIGLGAGLLSFIPYVGAIIGGVLAIGVGLVQFWPEYGLVAAVVGVFVLGQFVEGNFLSPKLVGSSIGIHPVWLMFALFAFGYLFGFVGLLLAVPMAAAAGVFVRYGLKQYLMSKFYKGLPGVVTVAIPTELAQPRSRRRKG